jgi:hypothetical protein
MIYGIYAIKDEKVGFLQVMQDTNDDTALRNFSFAMNRPEQLYASNKQDFALYKLGSFDTLTAEIILESTPKMIVSATSV